MNRVVRSWLAPAVLLLAGAPAAVAVPADDAPPRVEGFPSFVEGPVLTAFVPSVQPERVEPAAVCAGAEVTLRPPSGRVFSPRDSASRVLFAPCGIPGEILDWTPAGIRVKVPMEAQSGQVWLATGVDDAFAAELERGRACQRSLDSLAIVPERLDTSCDPSVGDPHDPRAATLLRGIPPSKDLPQGVPPVRADGRDEGEPPACRIIGPDRRAPLTFKAPKGTSVRMAGNPSSACFETCEQVGGGQVMLTVYQPPRVDRFLPDRSELIAEYTHRVERGLNRVSWRVSSPIGGTLTLARDGGAAAPVPMDGDTALDVLEPIELVLEGSNGCGTRRVVEYIQPATTLRVWPPVLDIVPGARSEVRVTIDRPLFLDLPVALDETSSGLIVFDTPRPVIPAGATEVRVGLTLSLRAESLGRGAQAGQVTARLATPGDPEFAALVDGRQLVRVNVSTALPVGAPGPGQTLVRGRLLYMECLPPGTAPLDGALMLDGAGCVLSPSGTQVLKPVRRARVEVWDQMPIPNVQRAVVDTDDNGDFRALVPSGGRYDVTVVASTAAGQVNFDNDAITWFWKPLGRAQAAPDAGTLVYDFTFNRSDSRHFNALDAIARGLEYAIDRGRVPAAAADAVFHQASVIPGTFTGGGITLAVGNQSHIWLNDASAIFRDKTILHEYGHHLQHSNGTYRAWGTHHNGCYATVVLGPACVDREVRPGGTDTNADAGCWVNSPQLAWFEGFPDYFARVVINFDAALLAPSFTLTRGDLFAFSPVPGSTCPLLSAPHFNHLNQAITGADIEDHVELALVRTLNATTVPGPDPRFPMTPRELEETVFQIFFNDMMGTSPSAFTFRDLWAARFPGNTEWLGTMAIFGMPLAGM